VRLIERWDKKIRRGIFVDDGTFNVPANCRVLGITSTKRKSIENLLSLKQLEGLHLYPVRADDLPVLGQLTTLKALFLYDIRVPSLEAIASLKGLTALRIMHAHKLKTLRGLDRLRELQALDIYHVPNTHSLDALAGLSNMRELSISMSMGTTVPLRFKSFTPLSGMHDLRVLTLSGVHPGDHSLRPLTTLRNLQHLTVSSDHPLPEYARLAASFPPTVLERCGPLFRQRVLRCKKCNRGLVLLVGKLPKISRRLVCPKCNEKLVDQHIKLFDHWVQKWRAR